MHGVDVEGKKCGIEEELVVFLGRHCPIPVTYAGGVRSLDDMELVKRLGNDKVTTLLHIFIIFVMNLFCFRSIVPLVAH